MAKIAYKPQTLRAGRLAQVDKANAIIEEYVAQGFRLTLRQLYYQFVSRGFIANSVQSYKQLGDVINEGRLQGLIDWEAIEDRTRGLASLSNWSDPSEIVGACAEQFRIDMWGNQSCRMEVWIEKEALAGVFEPMCNRYRVPFLSCKGYTSQSEMWAAAMRLAQWVKGDQDVVILHFGDHDPSGIDMSRDIQDRLKMFLGRRYDRLRFHRLALNMNQVQQYAPPPNPAKVTDARFEAYAALHGDESWELDALDPTTLGALIEDNIQTHLDKDRWEIDADTEAIHREKLKTVASKWTDVCKFLRKKK